MAVKAFWKDRDVIENGRTLDSAKKSSKPNTLKHHIWIKLSNKQFHKEFQGLSEKPKVKAKKPHWFHQIRWSVGMAEGKHLEPSSKPPYLRHCDKIFYQNNRPIFSGNIKSGSSTSLVYEQFVQNPLQIICISNQTMQPLSGSGSRLFCQEAFKHTQPLGAYPKKNYLKSLLTQSVDFIPTQKNIDALPKRTAPRS